MSETKDLNTERESWERALCKVSQYQQAHDGTRLSYDDSLKWKEAEAKNEARRMD